MKSTFLSTVLFVHFCLPTLSYSQAGSLDLSFNGTGIVTTAVGISEDQANAVAIQTDGKIVVVGSRVLGFSTDFSVLRYNTNGSLDNTFGTAGIVATNFGTADEVARAVAIQTDGKIVVAGYGTIGSKLNFTIARYQTNGSLDSTFGTNGKQNTAIGIYNDFATAIAIQTDGKILVTGYTQTNGFSYFTDFAMVRYTTNGTLDNNFGTGGIVTTDFASIFDYAMAIALQTDGKIVLAGESSTNPGDIDFAIARYNTDGSLDTTFDSDGKLITDFGNHNDEASSVAIQTDGKIVAGGFTNDSVVVAGLFAVTRYNTNGTLDTTFDHDGRGKNKCSQQYCRRQCHGYSTRWQNSIGGL
ncbi:MAG: delta-60 repeat domain-containing protein [Bacteroidetes bacterium]|nr:delta-60 repeat domain-containing protein [Bacteroidota bacterium]